MNYGEAFGIESEEYKSFDLEGRLWSLVDFLIKYRTEDLPPTSPIYPFSSSATIIDNLIVTDKSFGESSVLIRWLQNSLPLPEEPKTIHGTKWFNTSHYLKHTTKKNQTIIDHLDEDAPLREKKLIAAEDRSIESEYFKYIFKLLQANQLKTAHEFCEQTGNQTLALLLNGISYYFDPEIDDRDNDNDKNYSKKPYGIINKPLWRRMCWNLSQNPDLDDYERAIYGILSSDINTVINLSDTWELQLLTYLNYLFTTKSEQELINNGRIDSIVKDMPIVTDNITSIQNILERLERSNDELIHRQAAHPYRRIIAAIIKDDLPKIVNDTSNAIVELLNSPEIERDNEEIKETIRILVHLVLFNQIINRDCGEEKSINTLLLAYTEILLNNFQYQLIPLYVSFIKGPDAIVNYAFLLSKIEDPDQRLMQISLAHKYDLDLKRSVRYAVHNYIFPRDITISTNLPIEFHDNVSEFDLAWMKGVKWFEDASMWFDSVYSSITLYRMLLGDGKWKSAQQFSQLVSPQNVISRLDAQDIGFQAMARNTNSDDEADEEENLRNDTKKEITPIMRSELLEYAKLIDCFDLIETWKESYEKGTTSGTIIGATPAPTSPFGHTRKGSGFSLASATTTPKRTADSVANARVSVLWKRDATNLANKLVDSIQTLCETWMVDVIESCKYALGEINDDDDDNEIDFSYEVPTNKEVYFKQTLVKAIRLRTIYIPYLIDQLMTILIQAQHASLNFLRVAANLATFVASEDYRLYELLAECNMLKQFLLKVADACADGVIKGEKGIFV